MTRAVRNRVLPKESTTKPLIINGDMAIAQRGTSVTSVSTSGYKIIDRFTYVRNSDSVTTHEQSTDSPTNAVYSYKITVTTADSTVDGTQYDHLRHIVEGLNSAFLKWGTSDAKTITISFWVKSSVTGTYCLGLANDDFDRQYIKEYTINSANTWEKKTISITGDTTGTWKTDNDRGINIYWSLAIGSDLQGVEGWQSSSPAGRKMATSNQVNFVGTVSATFQLTLTQLEVGSFDSNSIPAFQFEDRGTSLARCQRYFEKITTSGGGDSFGAGVCFSATQGRVDIRYSTVKRANATITFGSAGDFLLQAGNKSQAPSSLSSAGSSLHGFFCHTANTGFTIGHGCVLLDNSTTDATIDASSEL